MADGSHIAATDPKGETRQTKPFSIRLTEDEKALLLERAGRLPLDVTLAGEARTLRRSARRSIQDHQAFARVLSSLGQSRLSSNLNQFARAANIDVLPVAPDTVKDLKDACAAVAAMRRDLMQALGLSEDGGPRSSTAASAAAPAISPCT